MGWQFILTDLNWTHIGEILNASERKISLPLNAHDTASFRVRLDNPLAGVLCSCEGFIKAYRNNVLQYTGPVVSAEEVGDRNGATVAITSAGMGWYWNKLPIFNPQSYLGPPNPLPPAPPEGAGYPVNYPVLYYSRWANTIMNQELYFMVDYITGPNTVTGTTTFEYAVHKGKQLNQYLTEVSSGFDGFDWRILPRENYWPGYGAFGSGAKFTSADVIGEEKPEAIFEWGTGTKGNASGYSRLVSRESQANPVYIMQSGGGVSTQNVISLDQPLYKKWGTLTDVVQTDITDTTLQYQLADEHVKVRKNPRVTLNITPHIDPQTTGRLPEFGVDYNVGDTITARARYNGSTRFDAQMRVRGVVFDIDDKGTETISLTLTEE